MANLSPFPTLDFLIPEVRRSLWRGGWLNGAAVIAVAVTLFIFGWGWQVSQLLSASVESLGNRLEITAYVSPDLPTAKVAKLREELAALPGVADFTWIDRDRAWAELQANLGLKSKQGELDLFETNPLSDEVKIRAQSLEQVAPLANQIAQKEGIESVQYLERALTGLQSVQRVVRGVTLMLVLLLSLTVVALVSAILRLIILVRQPEIEIMTLVGATQTWIYTPLFLQAASLGGGGGLLAWIVGWVSGQQLQQWLAQQTGFRTLAGNASLEWSAGLGFFLIVIGVILGLVSTRLALQTTVPMPK
ncbi:permease-like cell division protein FtsX [uncultured Thermosynechococcus sp.]|uniref:cell division protein FtsX n=1 Tax=uncultured Thermosynechococcus sp. TaxID=436945 RepID=UPI002637C378|nr:permease-like cell division protein FtsX [uncultured Thermosynechococcus sp.]